MATIYQLALMSENAYSGTSTEPQAIGSNSQLLAGLAATGGDWVVVTTSDNYSAPDGKSNWSEGYFAVAYYNKATGELIIANRGTVPSGDPATTALNLQSDEDILTNKRTPVQDDAAAFAVQAIKAAQGQGYSVGNVVETGHSLGGSEAQAAILSLSGPKSKSLLGSASVSGVLFNSPGIGGYPLNGTSATSYNVLNIVTQGDGIHLAGSTHLGNQITIPAGPDTSAIAALMGPAALTGVGAVLLLAMTLADLYVAHSMQNTVLPYLAPTGSGAQLGSQPWTTAGNFSGSTGNPSLPYYTMSPSGNLVVTDPESGISMTTSVSTDHTLMLATFSSNGDTALGQALASLGQVSIPLSEINQGLGTLAGASLIYENITRNPAGSGFNVTFQTGSSQASPTAGPQFVVSAANPNQAFDYAVPASNQTVVETIDNGPSNITGSIAVLGANGATTLAGGTLVAGQPDTWTDSNGDQYLFAPAAPGENIGTLTITQGLLGSGGNAIVIDNFDLAAAQGASGDLGIYLQQEINLTAGATAGTDPSAVFPAGSEQSYTFSTDSPSATAQTVTVTLSGANPSDFMVTEGNNVIALNPNGSFTLTLPAGQTNIAFGLIDVTADDGKSDIANGATLNLTASVANPQGGAPIQSVLAIAYTPGTPDTSQLTQTLNPILGQYNSNTGTTTYTGDGGDDLVSASGSSNAINLASSGSDSITGGSGSNTIYGGSGNDAITLNGTGDWVSLGNGFNTLSGSASGKDTIYGHGGDAVISGNGGTDLIFGRNGNSAIYAGAQTSLAQAIAQARSATATGKQGDLIAVGDGDNTIVGGDGNDLLELGNFGVDSLYVHICGSYGSSSWLPSFNPRSVFASMARSASSSSASVGASA